MFNDCLILDSGGTVDYFVSFLGFLLRFHYYCQKLKIKGEDNYSIRFHTAHKLLHVFITGRMNQFRWNFTV